MGMNAMLAQGLMTELSYMSAEAQVAAQGLETELLKDAAAGVDLRARLVGVAVSKGEG